MTVATAVSILGGSWSMKALVRAAVCAVAVTMTATSAVAAQAATADHAPLSMSKNAAKRVFRPVPQPAVVTGWTMSNRQSPNIRSGPGFQYRIVGQTRVHARVSGPVVGDWVRIAPNRYVNRGAIETKTSDVRSLNGRIPTSDLCPIPLAYNTRKNVRPAYTPSTYRYINCTALHGLNQLQAAYKAQFGTYATIDLGYRPYAEQQYWFRMLGAPTAAYPGTSNHGYGIAVDFQEDEKPGHFAWGHPGQVWLAKNAARFGWTNPFAYGTPHESYHFNFTG